MSIIVQVNPPGMASTDPGYISSITVRTGGSATVLTPSTVSATYGQITVDDSAGTQLVQLYQRFKLITAS